MGGVGGRRGRGAPGVAPARHRYAGRPGVAAEPSRATEPFGREDGFVKPTDHDLPGNGVVDDLLGCCLPDRAADAGHQQTCVTPVRPTTRWQHGRHDQGPAHPGRDRTVAVPRPNRPPACRRGGGCLPCPLPWRAQARRGPRFGAPVRPKVARRESCGSETIDRLLTSPKHHRLDRQCRLMPSPRHTRIGYSGHRRVATGDHASS